MPSSSIAASHAEISNADAAAPRARAPSAALAAFVVLVVGAMVVPLPSWLLDLLLASNLALSVSVLLMALLSRTTLQLSTFPSLLLLSTLLRLALNVSSTRLILLHGEAGDVIEAFGVFVVAGNYAVGAVVFVILATIQYLVIAKGSERVAEVSARFALDALPGRQLAIDSEVRNASIDSAEAERRRRTLSRESQLFGAMDGAMKFVKGDVVAAAVITAINLIAGVALGTVQRSMSAGEALRHYGLLTIGDGLVSQLPALLIGTAAGVLVTRVAGESRAATLGQQLAEQLASEPRAWFAGALFAAGLALVPGLPVVPFLAVAAGLAAVGYRAERREPSAGEVPDQGSREWSMHAHPQTVAKLSRDRPRRALERIAHDAAQRVRERLGVRLAECGIECSAGLELGAVVLSLRGVPARRIEVSASASRSSIVEHTAETLMDRAQDLLGLQEVQLRLDELGRTAPANVAQVVPRLVSLATLSEVLRRLVEERVSIADLKLILESLAQVADTGADPTQLAEHVRTWLRRPISYQLTGGGDTLRLVQVEPSLASAVRGGIHNSPRGPVLALSPGARQDIVACIDRALEQCPEHLRARPILRAPADVRRVVRKLVESRWPNARVVSERELLPELAIEVCARAQLADL